MTKKRFIALVPGLDSGGRRTGNNVRSHRAGSDVRIFAIIARCTRPLKLEQRITHY